ncbi:hypothetical protein [Reyranella sp. CPCC 100927]|uniref:hypothetical protein n=1 Tax=Reyranella sp. CPCC 100927 TaxID=2599616 RepID=UPI0011B7BA9A|nr:hypothetical protein [Reyranella sp. CPCC 100927]TWT13782.1 hypothetical protein FQU96_07685 [Reyranella sp. CPCC 100927]
MSLRRRAVLAGGVGLAVSLASHPLAARQLSFQRQRYAGQSQYRVRWLDHEQRERDISFALAAAEIDQAARLFREFSLEGLRDYIESAIRLTAAGWPEVKLEIERRSMTVDTAGIAYRLNGPQHLLADANRQVRQTIEQNRARYTEAYLRRVDGNTISVDYVAAARRYARALWPLAQALLAIAGNADERARVALALSFFQAIPYDELTDRVRNGGYDFAPPPTLLDLNRGDCDSKAVALACVLRAVAPHRRSAMATMPGHAILGVDVPWREGDAWVRRDGRVFIALEAAGPAMAPVGRVAPQTARFLDAQNFSVWPLSA